MLALQLLPEYYFFYLIFATSKTEIRLLEKKSEFSERKIWQLGDLARAGKIDYQRLAVRICIFAPVKQLRIDLWRKLENRRDGVRKYSDIPWICVIMGQSRAVYNISPSISRTCSCIPIYLLNDIERVATHDQEWKNSIQFRQIQ